MRKSQSAEKTVQKNIVLDAPTLFEAGADVLCRRVVSVLANADVRRARIMKRDGLTSEEAQRRMGAQHPDEFYAGRSDFILDNTVSVSKESVYEMLTAMGCAVLE